MLGRFLRQRESDSAERSQLSFQEYLNLVQPYMPAFSQQPGQNEPIDRTVAGYGRRGVAGNAVVYACAAVRLKVFSEIEFRWQQLANRDLSDDARLAPLAQPWQGAYSGDLLARCEMDITTAGNSYWINAGSLVRTDRVNLLRLQPEYCTIITERLETSGGVPIGWAKAGIVYMEPNSEGVFLDVSEIAHYAPMPDPNAQFRGMSWLTPVLREVEVDDQLTDYKGAHLRNQATPNLVISFDASVPQEHFSRLVEVVRKGYAGSENAGKTLMMGGGADVKVVGSTFENLAMKATQGALETRIAAAAGVPPVVVGLSEGLSGSSLNEGNYGQARRRFADGSMRPDWRAACAAFSTIVPPGAGERLWYTDRFVSFLQEDVADEANIRETHARAIGNLIQAGFKAPESVAAIVDGDFDGLKDSHSGLFSVQLQPAGQKPVSGEQMALDLEAT